MKLARVCGHTFIGDLLAPGSVVLDCGANHGEFATRLARDNAVRVYGFEPDPRLFPALPKMEKVRFFQQAISGVRSEVMLNLGRENCSSVRFSEAGGQDAVRVDAVMLDAFCREADLPLVDLLKLDIEGAEIEVLESLPQEFLASVGQITVEFHDFLDAAERPAVERVVERIKACGFHFVRFSYHDYSDCLFINTRRHPVGLLARTGLLLEKYRRGTMRKLRGMLNMPAARGSC